jgi:hypothetical protein
MDQSHPGVVLPRAAYTTIFPRCSNANITIRAFPKALLKRPISLWPDPPYKYAPHVKWSEQLKRLRRENVEGEVWNVNADAKRKVDAVDMSMSFVLGKKAVHKSAPIRTRTTRRLKAAISLLVTRGVDVRKTGKRTRLVLNDDGNINRHQWFSPGSLALSLF